MGGKAIKTVPIRRYDRREFDNIAQTVPEILKPYFKNIGIPLFFESKETFGDLDVLVSTDGFDYRGGMRDFIEDKFSPDEIHHNGNCWSFNYQEFQIDIITCSEKNFEANLNYLNYNDLGNLMGKLAHAMGLKYGQSGLFFRHKDSEGQKLGDIPITKDLGKICEVLDLDVSVIQEGFTELEEIFIFITNSKYFDWKRVQFDQLDRVNRERDKKRDTYASFIKWIDEHVRDDNHTFEDIDKKTVVKAMDKKFPEAELVINMRRMDYLHAQKRYISAKFNGGMVIREYIEDVFKDYNTFILNNDSNEIMRQFKISCGR
jgi:hypothetical protein